MTSHPHDVIMKPLRKIHFKIEKGGDLSKEGEDKLEDGLSSIMNTVPIQKDFQQTFLEEKEKPDVCLSLEKVCGFMAYVILAFTVSFLFFQLGVSMGKKETTVVMNEVARIAEAQKQLECKVNRLHSESNKLPSSHFVVSSDADKADSNDADENYASKNSGTRVSAKNNLVDLVMFVDFDGTRWFYEEIPNAKSSNIGRVKPKSNDKTVASMIDYFYYVIQSGNRMNPETPVPKRSTPVGTAKNLNTSIKSRMFDGLEGRQGHEAELSGKSTSEKKPRNNRFPLRSLVKRKTHEEIPDSHENKPKKDPFKKPMSLVNKYMQVEGILDETKKFKKHAGGNTDDVQITTNFGTEHDSIANTDALQSSTSSGEVERLSVSDVLELSGHVVDGSVTPPENTDNVSDTSEITVNITSEHLTGSQGFETGTLLQEDVEVDKLEVQELSLSENATLSGKENLNDSSVQADEAQFPADEPKFTQVQELGDGKIAESGGTQEATENVDTGTTEQKYEGTVTQLQESSKDGWELQEGVEGSKTAVTYEQDIGSEILQPTKNADENVEQTELKSELGNPEPSGTPEEVMKETASEDQPFEKKEDDIIGSSMVGAELEVDRAKASLEQEALESKQESGVENTKLDEMNFNETKKRKQELKIEEPNISDSPSIVESEMVSGTTDFEVPANNEAQNINESTKSETQNDESVLSLTDAEQDAQMGVKYEALLNDSNLEASKQSDVLHSTEASGNDVSTDIELGNISDVRGNESLEVNNQQDSDTFETNNTSVSDAEVTEGKSDESASVHKQTNESVSFDTIDDLEADESEGFEYYIPALGGPHLGPPLDSNPQGSENNEKNFNSSNDQAEAANGQKDQEYVFVQNANPKEKVGVYYDSLTNREDESGQEHPQLGQWVQLQGQPIIQDQSGQSFQLGQQPFQAGYQSFQTEEQPSQFGELPLQQGIGSYQSQAQLYPQQPYIPIEQLYQPSPLRKRRTATDNSKGGLSFRKPRKMSQSKEASTDNTSSPEESSIRGKSKDTKKSHVRRRSNNQESFNYSLKKESINNRDHEFSMFHRNKDFHLNSGGSNVNKRYNSNNFMSGRTGTNELADSRKKINNYRNILSLLKMSRNKTSGKIPLEFWSKLNPREKHALYKYVIRALKREGMNISK